MSPVPTFASTETDPVARGREFGAAWRPEIEGCLAGYAALFRAFGATDVHVETWGRQALDEIAGWAPTLAAEITGLAGGAGVEPWQVAALNARTEILAALRAAGPGECSTAVVLPAEGGPPRTIQTWDWRDAFSDVPVVWSYEPRPRHAVRTFTEFGVLAKIGVNGAGLGVHLNILRHASDHGEIGVPVHVVARRILDEAADVETATDIARSARTSASTVLTVTGFDGEHGEVRGLELCPAGLRVVSAGTDGVYLHTNHFLHPELASGDRQDAEPPTTFERLEHLSAQAGEIVAAVDVTKRAHALLSHREDGAPVCAHAALTEPFHLRSATLATISLDLAGRRLVVHRGGPCAVTETSWQVIS